jgi:hypothetical protein
MAASWGLGGFGAVDAVRGAVPFQAQVASRRVLAQQVLLRAEQETAGAGRRVDDALAGLRVD